METGGEVGIFGFISVNGANRHTGEFSRLEIIAFTFLQMLPEAGELRLCFDAWSRSSHFSDFLLRTRESMPIVTKHNAVSSRFDVGNDVA